MIGIVLSVSGAGACIVKAYSISAVSPDVPKVVYEVIIFVVTPHLLQQVPVAYVELLEDSLKSYQG